MSEVWEWPYEHRDEVTSSTWLRIEPEPGADGSARVSVTGGRFVSVTDLAPVVAALYGATGQPAPVILDRPKRLYPDLTFGPDLKVARGDAVTALWLGAEARTLGPDQARRLAAYLAICAEADESAAADAEVEELAGVICTGLLHEDTQPGDGDRKAARAALRWMKDKQQRGETP